MSGVASQYIIRVSKSVQSHPINRGLDDGDVEENQVGMKYATQLSHWISDFVMRYRIPTIQDSPKMLYHCCHVSPASLTNSPLLLASFQLPFTTLKFRKWAHSSIPVVSCDAQTSPNPFRHRFTGTSYEHCSAPI